MAEETATKEKEETEVTEDSTADVSHSATKKTAARAERTVYELGYHIVATVDEQNVPKEVATLKSAVESAGGTFISEEFPMHMPLAYTMIRSRGGTREKHSSTHFGWVKFDMNPEQVLELKEKLSANEHILRYLLFKTVRDDTRAPKHVLTPPKPAEPQPRPKLMDTPKKEEPKGPVSDEELDRTIEQLVVE